MRLQSMPSRGHGERVRCESQSAHSLKNRVGYSTSPPLDLFKCASVRPLDRGLRRGQMKKDRSVVVENLLLMLLQFSMHSFVNNSHAMREELRAIYRRGEARYVRVHTVFFGAANRMSPGGDGFEISRRAIATTRCAARKNLRRSTISTFDGISGGYARTLSGAPNALDG